MSKPGQSAGDHAGKAKRAPREDSGRFDISKVAVGAILVAMAAAMYRLQTPARPNVPLRPTPFEYHYMSNVFANETLAELDALMAAQSVFETAAQDLTASVDNIGEALPINDPGCDNPMLSADGNFSRCLLPSRIDIARHYLSTGGPDNFQERYESMVPRLLSFIGYMFDKLDTPAIQNLFNDPKYIAKASEGCRGRSVFDPIQLNLILMLPGQELPMHWDVPWLWGATRFDLPQWLLVVMEQSGLWQGRSIPQIQGVSWLHDAKDGDGGDFFFYPRGAAGESQTVPAKRNSAIVLDGCRAIHGVRRFKPAHKVPPMSRRVSSELRHLEGNKWELVSNGTQMATYTTSDFRMSLVWRARCFESEEEKARWHNDQTFPDGKTHKLELPEVLDTLEADLRKRGVLGPGAARPAPLQFAMMLLDTYAQYPNDPVTTHIIAYNLCMIPRIVPAWLRPAAEAVADVMCA
jgi:hypothetical protein